MEKNLKLYIICVNRSIWLSKRLTKTMFYKYLGHLVLRYLWPSFKFCWIWIFTLIKISWHFGSMWDKLGCLNWFWQFLSNSLSFFNPEGFYYSYAWFAAYVKEVLPFARDLPLKNSADFYLCFRLALLHSVPLFFFLYWLPSSSLCSVFDSVSCNIDEVHSINLSANVFVFGDLTSSVRSD